MAWRNRVEVSYGALAANVRAIKQVAGERALIAVVKADAYGLGIERCARIYVEAGADAIAVASFREADRVRRTLPGVRIILLGSPLPEERPAVVASGYEVCCSSIAEAHEFAALADPAHPHPIHCFVDTGMGRAGCAPAAAAAFVAAVIGAPSLRLAGVGSHYPMAADAAGSADQEAIWAEVLAGLPAVPTDCWLHLANSEGLLLRPVSGASAVRCGLLLTGVVPAGCPDPGLQPAVRWLSSISLVKTLPADHTVSYNRLHRLDASTPVALVPVGYADGYPLACSQRGAVLIQGRRCAILGRVTMDYLVVDVSGCPREPVPGDPVVLVGQDGDASITISDLAEWAGTIAYDVLCGLRGRCEVVGVP